MRIFAAITTVLLLGLLCLASGRTTDTCAVELKLIDAVTGRELPGLVRIRGLDGTRVQPIELLPRGLGLKEPALASYASSIHDWSVVPKTTVIHLPRKPLVIEAFSGLETETSTARIDLSGQSMTELTMPLVSFDNTARRGLRSANTHLHLMKISRAEADRYLVEVPQADGLDMLYVSYLERAGADPEYISNRYTSADLASLEEQSGVVFGNGEEHRHNFKGYGDGYGHVMLLNIKKLIQPVSIGPGIMKTGTDGLPLARGIETARHDGATIVWCHNDMGRESLPNFLAGRIHALNIFDGSMISSYKDSFYRYLNAGLRVPFSTGTDWFQYDFSRVYVDVEGEPTVEKWLNSLAAGRSFITNGPLLEFTVSGTGIGGTVQLQEQGKVALKARATGRGDFEQIEIIKNGKVLWTALSRRVGGHHEATLSVEAEVDEPCWFALRTPPPPIERVSNLQVPVGKNEFDRWLYAHTSAIYVNVAGRSQFDKNIARGLLSEMRADRDKINRIGTFADEQERARVLDVYSEGIQELERRLAER